jgi:hypothetical protein
MAFNNDTFLELKFIELKNKYNIKSVIETGTYYADTTKWMSLNFDNVFTCEINEAVHNIAKAELYGYENVVHKNEDTRTFLPYALENSTGNTLVFLDAHWYENPLLEEIKIIGDSNKYPIIAIHDFKVPNKPFGYDKYHNISYEWSYINNSVDNAFPNGYKIEYNSQATGASRGCIFIIPNHPQWKSLNS